jgi:ribosomal protein S18 acetylase RimI-like enzyme
MIPTLNLRKVKPEDIDSIVDIDKVFGPDAFSKYVFEDYIEDCIDYNGFFYALEVEGVLVGYIIVIHGLDSAYNIESIAIRPEFQKTNCGKFVLETIESFIVRDGGSRISLHVSDKNLRARKFYEKFGYQYTGIEHKHFYIDGTTALGMEKILIPLDTLD